MTHTDESLGVLIGLTRGGTPLPLLLAVVPLNLAGLLFLELRASRARRRIARGILSDPDRACFDEEVHVAAAGPFPRQFLQSCGFRVRERGDAFSAVRGVPALAARVLFLSGLFFFFSGILLSVTLRQSVRLPLVEGEPLPAPMEGGAVDSILLRERGGWVLARDVEVAVAGPRGRRIFGLYPPGRSGGAWVYPRFLGVAPLLSVTGPEGPAGEPVFALLNIYPPGREDASEIPGTPYRVRMRLLQTPEGDGYSTGKFLFSATVLRGDAVVASGTVPAGGELQGDRVRLALPQVRRFVAVDLVKDPGLPLVWVSLLLLPLSLLVWLPLRLLLPRGEMVFLRLDGGMRAFATSEGGARRTLQVFHEAVDLLCREPAEKDAK